MVQHDPRTILLRGVRVHNLKNLDLDLPRDRLIVVTGVSGSGKSSLAFDTLYAEGQRRYIETFSAYTRQFLQRLDKPDADRIDNLPPALAIAQRAPRRSGRSTVGTVTEIHDYLALLYARRGRVVCLRCGTEVRPADPAAVIGAIEALPPRTRYLIAFPIELRPDSDRQALASWLREDGFVRLRVGGELVSLEAGPIPPTEAAAIDVVVDRLVRGSEARDRLLDSIETAFVRGQGRCRLIHDAAEITFHRAWRCASCGADYHAPEPRLFSYNSPIGACPTCEGFGRVIALDLNRIVPDPARSLRDGALAPWTTPAHEGMQRELLHLAPRLGIPTDRPFRHLTPQQIETLVEGDAQHGFLGLRGFFERLERKAYKMHVRVFLSRWRGYRPCPDCGGARLKPEARAVRLGGLDLAALEALRIDEALRVLSDLAASESAHPVARRLLDQILARLTYLDRIGLGYLALDRQARTLSGGEAQRVALTSALGSGLVNMLYVLDEPTSGLHPRDVGRLIGMMRSLRDAGNTVVTVEHDLTVMRASDLLVDLGPGAGESGGRLLYAGPPDAMGPVAESATSAFLTGRKGFLVPERRRATDQGWVQLSGASGHNLKDLDVAFPLGVLCMVTGVSGAGKSTLVEETLYPALARRLRNEPLPALPYRQLRGTSDLDDVALIDPTPIGRSPRSNPVTYLKAFDEIRKTFAATHEARLRNFSASRFSFNVEGGRCHTCEGNGYLTIDMQFLADVLMRCPECQGRRYRPEVLEITYRGRNIAEVLELTVREAFVFFRHRPKVQARLRPLMEVGLDYLRLGQPASTLSGGEAQRLKLAARLAGASTALGAIATATAEARSRTLFLLDEPTTGLHPADTLKLVDALTALLNLGHSLVVVEHSPELMVHADWIIDLGPEAGDDGGRVVAQGPPEDIARTDTHTGRALAEILGASAT